MSRTGKSTEIESRIVVTRDWKRGNWKGLLVLPFGVMGMIWPQRVEMAAQHGEYMKKPLNCTLQNGEFDVM